MKFSRCFIRIKTRKGFQCHVINTLTVKYIFVALQENYGKVQSDINPRGKRGTVVNY